MWTLAEDAAARLRHVWPQESFVAGFAALERGEHDRARTYFLHASLNHPLSARMLAGLGKRQPRTDSVDARDHNAGIELQGSIGAYLKAQSTPSRTFFREFVQSERVERLIDEARSARKRWSEDRSSQDRTDFDTMQRMASWGFAAAEFGSDCS